MGRSLIKSAYKAYGRNFAVSRIGEPGVKMIESVLFSKNKQAKSLVTAGKALKATKLGSYLDKTYQRKCGVEIKRLETVLGATALTTTCAGITQYPGNLAIAQGDTDTTRTGSSIEVKSMSLKFTAQANPTATQPTRVRLFLVKSGPNAGVIPVAGDVVRLTTNIRSPLPPKEDITYPLTILKQWEFTLGVTGVGKTDRMDFVWTYVPKGCHEINWTSADTTGATVNMTKGEMTLWGYHETLGTAGAPSIYVWSEMKWLDI